MNEPVTIKHLASKTQGKLSGDETIEVTDVSHDSRRVGQGTLFAAVTGALFDARVTTTPADYAKQLELSLKIRDKLSGTHNAILQIRDVRSQVEDLLKRVAGQPNFKVVNDAGTTLNKKLTAIEETLYQIKNQSNQDPLNNPIRLNNKLAALGGVVASADTAPTAQSYAVYDELVAQIDADLQKLAQLMRTDFPAFNQLVRDQTSRRWW